MKNFRSISLAALIISSGTIAVAGWNLSRDNTFIVADDAVGRAMYTLRSKVASTQATQVCPGVFLTTAHSSLNNPSNARENGRPLGDPYNQRIKVYPYPLRDKTSFNVSEITTSFYSSWLNDVWGDNTAPPNSLSWVEIPTLEDFVFIKMDKDELSAKALERGFQYDPNEYVALANVNANQASLLSNELRLPIYLYRSETLYPRGEDGLPIFDEALKARTFEDLKTIYDAPMRVFEQCRIGLSDFMARGSIGRLFSSNCPEENHVSGSPYAVHIDDVPLIVGIHKQGYDAEPGSRELNLSEGEAIASANMCKEYENACGHKCASLDHILAEK